MLILLDRDVGQKDRKTVVEVAMTPKAKGVGDSGTTGF